MSNFYKYSLYSVYYIFASQVIPMTLTVMMTAICFGVNKGITLKESGFHISVSSLYELISFKVLSMIFGFFFLEFFVILGIMYFADAFIKTVVKSIRK